MSEDASQPIGRLAADVLARLAQPGSRRKTLATAESCTGGGVAAALTAVPGASHGYLGGMVTYANRTKVRLAHVDPGVLDTEGAVSKAVAIALAEGARRALDADLAVSTTGIAGPTGGTAKKPVGTVWIGIADREGSTAHRFVHEGDREQNQAAFVRDALRVVLDHVDGKS